MNLGLKLGATGALVERLHGILHAAGFGVDPEEKKQAAFGPSTVAALKTLQAQQGLPDHGEVDPTTLKVLLELEGKVTLGSREGGTPPANSPPGDGEPRGTVYGKLVDGDGEPLAGTLVTVFSQRVRETTPLNSAATSATGDYSIRSTVPGR